MQFITAYGPKIESSMDFDGVESMTKQHHKEECDINNILAKFQRTGVLEFAQQHAPQYADVTGVDFRTAMETVATAQEMFADLPSSLRNRFSNDPAMFLDFVQDPENRAEAAGLGLLEARAEGSDRRPQGQPAGSGRRARDNVSRTRRKADSLASPAKSAGET